MRAFTFTQIIDRPPQQVWDVLSDLSLAPRWRALITSMRTEDGGPLRPGSRVIIEVDAFGKRTTRVSEFVVFEPPLRQVIRSVDQPVLGGAFEFRLAPHPRGTEVTFLLDLVPKTFSSWLMLPWIARGERRLRREMLGKLKRVVEEG